MQQRASDWTWRHIVDPDAAELLVDVRQLRFLTPFLSREATVGQAARELGIGNDAMYYRVQRMVDHGILEVTRVEPRAGKPVKHYSVVADGLFVPFSATPADTVGTLLLAIDTTLERDLTTGIVATLSGTTEDTSGWGFRIYRDVHGRPRLTYAPSEAPLDWDVQTVVRDETFPAVLFDWIDLELTRSEAKELQRRLLDLQCEFQVRAKERRGREPTDAYLVRLAMAPLEDGTG